ncbi:MAG: DASS family sodium-coupled anion symporter [Archangiaceae bacterium]|nr:DASS family sodium-coupled anion symporter [Archangiaceae bacterium]
MTARGRLRQRAPPEREPLRCEAGRSRRLSAPLSAEEPAVGRRRALRLALILFGSTALYFVPAPAGLDPRAWSLFAIFLGVIALVVASVVPIVLAALLGTAAAVLTGTLTGKEAYAGFSEDFILLIVSAFVISRAMLESGLGARIAWFIIRRLGKSTLGLAYSVLLTDLLIASAFPSNTARSSIFFPVLKAICVSQGSLPGEPSRLRLGRYLMMSSMAGISLSSALWLTAMAGNLGGAKIASEHGVHVTFGSWALAASVPVLACAALVPWLLFRVMKPEVQHTPDAPEQARAALAALGPMKRLEIITLVVFTVMVALWALSSVWKLDRTAVAFLGLAVLLLTGAYPRDGFKREGEALEIWLWFALLYTLSTQLNTLGFMRWLGGGVSAGTAGLPPPVVYVLLTLAYVAIHYFFVSQSAHLLALAGVFLQVAVTAGVAPALISYQLLFATNYFSCLTPQGSSANVLFVGSGYLTTSEVYRFGGLVTAVNTAVFLTLGSAWFLLVA